ncbi:MULTISPECIES: flagellar hook assembly protein FlgD [Afifella]|uniref:flagellar hook assembly protein FlgD n=1 Tax=Afifella TaxID=643217 RepID=UPI000FE349D3|nr:MULTISPECIES: flagellar hook assembly protein FlgD [Afifella]MCT8267854.1 flagellar hook assembly protein FlgD [Afifella sp. JA880]
MTSTSGVGAGTTAAANSNTNNPGSTVDYDTFLKLLVTQLKNQDPTSPMETTQYMAQLASFSQVEQTIQTNNKLDEILTSSAIGQANELIGHTVTSPDGSTTGTVASVRITSNGLIANLDDGTQMLIGAGVTVA